MRISLYKKDSCEDSFFYCESGKAFLQGNYSEMIPLNLIFFPLLLIFHRIFTECSQLRESNKGDSNSVKDIEKVQVLLEDTSETLGCGWRTHQHKDGGSVQQDNKMTVERLSTDFMSVTRDAYVRWSIHHQKMMVVISADTRHERLEDLLLYTTKVSMLYLNVQVNIYANHYTF